MKEAIDTNCSALIGPEIALPQYGLLMAIEIGTLVTDLYNEET